jgi:hypothetical protein
MHFTQFIVGVMNVEFSGNLHLLVGMNGRRYGERAASAFVRKGWCGQIIGNVLLGVKHFSLKMARRRAGDPATNSLQNGENWQCKSSLSQRREQHGHFCFGMMAWSDYDCSLGNILCKVVATCDMQGSTVNGSKRTSRA